MKIGIYVLQEMHKYIYIYAFLHGAIGNIFLSLESVNTFILLFRGYAKLS